MAHLQSDDTLQVEGRAAEQGADEAGKLRSFAAHPQCSADHAAETTGYPTRGRSTTCGPGLDLCLMTVIDLQSEALHPIRAFASVAAWSSEIATGIGQAHIHVVRMDAGGVIGPHEAAFGQLFLVVSGVAWAAGPDGERRVVEAGQAAYIK